MPFFQKTIPIVASIETGGLATYSGGTIQIPEGIDPFTVIASLPPAQITAIRDLAAEQMKDIPETLIKQYATVYISAEYKNLGMNLSRIQKGYMFRVGALMLLLTLAGTVCSIIVGYVAAKISSGMGRNVRLQLFKKVESFSNTEFEKFSTASLITMSTNDISQIQMLMVMLLPHRVLCPYHRCRRHIEQSWGRTVRCSGSSAPRSAPCSP